MRLDSLVGLAALLFVSQASSAFSLTSFSLESTGIDGDFVFGSSPDLIPRESGRYEFSSFELRTGDVLDVTSPHAGEHLYLLANGDVTIDGDLVSEGKILVVGSSGVLTINGRIKAPMIGIFADEIINHGSLEPALGLAYVSPIPSEWGDIEISDPLFRIVLNIPPGSTLENSGSIVMLPHNPVPLPPALPLLGSAIALLGAAAYPRCSKANERT